MSLHTQINQEARERLQRQRRNSTIASLLISLLIIALIGAILAFVLIAIPTTKMNETLVSYQAAEIEEVAEIVTPTVETDISKAPAPPASSAAFTNTITSASVSNISIPDTDLATNTESLDFGETNDFGELDGFDFEQDFDEGAEEGFASFFGAKVQGNKICFVIDYSKSMIGERDRLMRKELARAVKNLKGSNSEFALIFFAGPVWEAGDEAIVLDEEEKDERGEVVSLRDDKTYLWKRGGGWQPDGKQQTFQWRSSSAAEIRKSIRQIEDTPLVYGTLWHYPLEMAIEMKPDVIIFMTDGTSGNASAGIAKAMGKLAKRKRITVNTIALMQPQAREALLTLADLTGGSATMVISEDEIIDLKTEEEIED